MATVIDKTWFTCSGVKPGSVGIVLVEDEFGEKKAYIGISHNAYDEGSDAENIADWGASFPLSAAKTFFPYKC
jgi:hypothetical protein